jgi:hypothetical protein
MVCCQDARAGLALLLVAGLLLAGCGNAAETPAGSDHGDSISAAVGHVHGLGVDPDDGALYVATHHGLYRMSAVGRLDPVGTLRHDLMGFTIAGPKTFLASGHPAPGEQMANPLGLVESRDGGVSWTTLSRSGESDFHALDTAGSTVYGFDGVLRASGDGGRNWQTRAQIAAADIAVNPRDSNMLVATTEEGVVGSTDGGRTFSPAKDPLLVFVAWSALGSVYGLGPDGAVHASADGATWTKTGALLGGRPQALGLASDGRVFAATATGIFESRDNARTFAKLS